MDSRILVCKDATLGPAVDGSCRGGFDFTGVFHWVGRRLTTGSIISRNIA